VRLAQAPTCIYSAAEHFDSALPATKTALLQEFVAQRTGDV
jgi:hypothetical protein